MMEARYRTEWASIVAEANLANHIGSTVPIDSGSTAAAEHSGATAATESGPLVMRKKPTRREKLMKTGVIHQNFSCRQSG